MPGFSPALTLLAMHMTFTDSKQRFSNRVADYIRYRPGYPSAVRDVLRSRCALKSGHVVADIGSGTGFFSKLFLKNGNRVFGVEPNEAMRQAGEEYLASYDGFASVEGSAKTTTLDDAEASFCHHWPSVPLVRPKRRPQRIYTHPQAEWLGRRDLERALDGHDGFPRDYEALLRKFGTDYATVKESYPSEQHMRDFFGAGHYNSRMVPNFQEFDFDGLAGRLRSSSFIPAADAPNYAPMMEELQRIFAEYNQSDRVRMEYSTHIYFGQLEGTL